MFNDILLLAYRAFRERGGKMAPRIEQNLCSHGDVSLSLDERQNLPDVYVALFSATSRPQFEQLFLELLDEMNGRPYDQCGDILGALAFLQEIAATALWKYQQNVGERIEAFVRDFDRLDVLSERVRLYEVAQSH